MEKTIHKYEIEWNGITIEIRYTPQWSLVVEELSHLEIKSINPEGCPLPITKTGYKSHFFHPTKIEEFDNPASYVRQWLDYAAKSKEWIELQESWNQLSLF